MPNKISVVKVVTGVYFVEIKEINLKLLCGCPANISKHLRKKNIIKTITSDDKKFKNFDTGPNAILLSDILMQNGDFSNLTEFPILHMLYLQGMIIPGHPNNDGSKPILIGTKKQLDSQLEYIKRGNYGLYNIEELQKAGLSYEEAEMIMKIKLYFAFGKIKESSELIQSIPFRGRIAKIHNKAFILRKSLNVFEISYENETIIIDLNLKFSEKYDAPYQLDHHFIDRHYFSIINSGNGDGWHITRPCTSSIIIFQGRIYLIDSGPNCSYILNSLGIDIAEVDGIYITHTHDDHIAGLTTLMTSNHKIKVFSTRDVIMSVYKKLSALTNIKEQEFYYYFDIRYLEYNKWQNVEGLDVYAFMSPHPVETAIYRFKTIDNNGDIKIYAHNADIASDKVLEQMLNVNKQDKNLGIDEDFYSKVLNYYKKYADIKKIDVGGGLIHGSIFDYDENKDKSNKKILSHKSKEYTDEEKKIGIDVPFGFVDVLIESQQHYIRELAYRYLKTIFPTVKSSELEILLNCKIKKFEKGTIFIKIGDSDNDAFLLLTGTVSIIKPDSFNKVIRAGSIIGDLAALENTLRTATCKTISPARMLVIPSKTLKYFMDRNNLTEEFIRKNKEKLFFIQKTALLDDGISSLDQHIIAENIIFETYKKRDIIIKQGNKSKGLFILREGEVELYKDKIKIETIKPYKLFGESAFLSNSTNKMTAIAKTVCEIGRIENNKLLDIPIIRFRLRELEDKRKEKFMFKKGYIID